MSRTRSMIVVSLAGVCLAMSAFAAVGAAGDVRREDRRADRRADRQADRQADRREDRQADRQAGRQADKPKVVVSVSTTTPKAANNSGSNSGSSNKKAVTPSRDVRLEARMGAGGLEAKGRFEQRARQARSKFSVEVNGAQPGQSFPVLRNGVVILTITANNLGIAKAELHMGGDNTPQAQLPTMVAGDVITIGTFSAPLAAR